MKNGSFHDVDICFEWSCIISSPSCLDNISDCFLVPLLVNSVSLMLKKSDININNLKGVVKVKGMLIVYFAAFLIWVKDDSPTLDKTMTYLDNYLNRAEFFLKLVK